MKNFPLLFLGIFSTLAFAFAGLILSTNIQLGDLTRTTEALDEDGNPVAGETLYPVQPTGLAQQGKQVYLEMGCMYCHTQQVRRESFGADIERGWAPRQTVARDYIFQERVVLGSMRTGPDLASIGGQRAEIYDRAWHHLHLYNPQITSPGSTMPPFPFLYEVRPVGDSPSKTALAFPDGSEFAPGAGYQVVPTRRAEVLVDYLLSLKIDYSLPEAQIVEE